MWKQNKTAKSALIIIIFTLGSKFLGFFREVLIASKFASGMETDTFFIALTAIGSLGSKGYIVVLFKTGLASVIMGVVSYLIYHSLHAILGASKLHHLVSLLVAAGLGVLVYVVLCYVFNVEEVRDLVGKIRKVKNQQGAKSQGIKQLVSFSGENLKELFFLNTLEYNRFDITKHQN